MRSHADPLNSNNTEFGYYQRATAPNSSHVDNAPSIVTSRVNSEDHVLLPEESSQRGRQRTNKFGHPEHPVRVC